VNNVKRKTSTAWNKSKNKNITDLYMQA